MSISLVKVCSKCGESRKLVEYPIRRLNCDGLSGVCRICKRAYEAKYRKNKTEMIKKISKKTRLKAKYGLTLEEANELTSKGCQVCGTYEGVLCIDHCHTTGKVRGCLCTPCNLALGYLKENTNLMYQLINYTTKHKGE